MFPSTRLIMPVAAAAALLAACGKDERAAGFPSAGTATTTATTGTPARTAAAGALRLAPVGRFSQPVFVTGAPGDTRRVFVVEQSGRIRVVRGGTVLSRPFLDIRSRVTNSGEQGLLSMAFAPDYRRSGRFYVYYTDKDQQQRVVEFRRSTADRARLSSARLVLRMADPESNHNGGQLQFGPDGLLYMGTGDGGGADDQHGTRGNAQDLGSPLGKLLRIDPRRTGSRSYRVPSSNPFRGRAGARPEIYSYGLRNPWRFSFDRSTGDLMIADVGQDQVEEVDFAPRGTAKGANFGWRPLEGTRKNFPAESAPGAVPPVIQHSHDDGWCSITGGYVVRDPDLPALRGRYVYGDYCQGRIRGARLTAGRAEDDRETGLPTVPRLSSFGQDTRGRIYVASLEGPVYRLAQ